MSFWRLIARSGVALLCLVTLLSSRVSAAADPPALAASGDAAPSASEQAFLADLRALTRAPHRLAGSEAGLAAAQYIHDRLVALGVEVWDLEMPVWQARTRRCSLEVAGVSIELSPLRANVFVPPVTPPDGLSAPTMYVGHGEAADYGTRSAAGKIVVLDYDSADNWERAFAFGAKALVFIGAGAETPLAPKHGNLPINQLRFYAPATALRTLDLRSDQPNARLTSDVVWERKRGRNLIARVRGTDATFAKEHTEPEAVVVSANFDSFGVVPERVSGARGAGNVAALLEAATRFKRTPAKRDLILMFLDGDAFAHQGAREVYDALLMASDQARDLSEGHQRELAHVSAMRELLARDGLAYGADSGASVGGPTALWLKRALSSEADFAHDDVNKELQVLRLKNLTQGSGSTAGEAALAARALHWDELRRALHEDKLRRFVEAQRAIPEYASLFAELEARTRGRSERRSAELLAIRHTDAERDALRAALTVTQSDGTKPPWIVLHVAYDFADRGSTWGAVQGDYSNRLFAWRAPRADGDMPGYYSRVLNALGEAAKRGQPLAGLDPATLQDPMLGPTFAPGPFASEATVAGAYGIYNLSFMTGYDARSRDGHPADELELLDWQNLRRQALAGTELVARAADSLDLSLARVFKPLAKSRYPGFADGQSKGDYAGLQVSGTLSEDRPASGALLAVWPGSKALPLNAWTTRRDAALIAGYEPTLLEAVDERGRFGLIGVREDMFTELMTIGALFDEHGLLRAISTQEQQAQKLTEQMRVNLFTGPGFGWTSLRTYEAKPELLKVLKASSDAPFRENRSLWGQLDNQGFAYVSDQIVGYRLKLFQPMGPVALGEFTNKAVFGAGLAPEALERGIRVSETSARDLWNLNEERLGRLRARGVTSADLEILHARAKRARDRASSAADIAHEQASLLQSASLSQRVYQPLRLAMDDLVHAVVLLLLLSIPFAFAMERLTISAATIYGRIAGFSVCFLITFGILYVLHPGFAIASTPVLIFLAFAVVLMSSVVIYIVIRKFTNELRVIQGQGQGLHELEVSRAGTLLAAIGMGVSTMRRRRTRTALTAVTVVMLTFTILCFASFSRTVGVRSIYQGPASEQTSSGVLIRKLDYSEILPGVLDMLRGTEGPAGLLAPQYWLVRKDAAAPRFSVARPDTGEALTLDAVMGVSSEEIARWPELGLGLGAESIENKRAMLATGGVFLPAIMRDVLHVQIGDPILLNGRSARFAGVLDAGRLQRLRNLDGQSVLPVDVQDAATLAAGQHNDATPENQLLVADEVDRDFVHLSSEQVIVGSSEFVRSLGGTLHAINAYPGAGVDVTELGRRLAEIVVMPVWAVGPQGVERLLLTVLTDVSGGFALFVPLLLGGLIIFGTLLGSISDREKEIYTFSALGLSPGHVGMLFFAEAFVYAVVGGMGGQLLAEFVGLAASALARRGYVESASINYSSTNSLFAIGIVMITVLISAIYPAVRASRSANPGLARSWRMPKAEGDSLKIIFPFTVSAYDITGVVSFLAEHFRSHDDAGIGAFAASAVAVRKDAEGNLELSARLALAPFDLGVTEHITLTAIPSEIPGVDEVAIALIRESGARADWYRQNQVFIRDLRRQFLVWRTLSSDVIDRYRLETLEILGEPDARVA